MRTSNCGNDSVGDSNDDVFIIGTGSRSVTRQLWRHKRPSAIDQSEKQDVPFRDLRKRDSVALRGFDHNDELG
jgi:hypothetical protein